MKNSTGYFNKSSQLSVAIIIISLLLLTSCIYHIGLRYETLKLKSFVTTLVLAILYQFFIGDIILFFGKSFFNAKKGRIPFANEDTKSISNGIHNKKLYLERKLAALQYQLKLGSTFYKRNKNVTLYYRDILSDMMIYGTYLIVLQVAVYATRDPLIYHNTHAIRRVIRYAHISPFGSHYIQSLPDIYTFLNQTIVYGILDGPLFNRAEYNHVQMGEVLGVVRVRQLRYKSLKDGSDMDQTSYDPKWLHNTSSLPFKDRFWRIFGPWLYQDKQATEGRDETGDVQTISGEGYVALLGRNVENCQRVLNFLISNEWIDELTAVVIVEFTLYNPRADMFTVVVVSVEQTGFNTFQIIDRVNSYKLLFNIDNFSTSVLIVFLAYFFMITKVISNIVFKIWYSSAKEFLSHPWNYVDVLIVLLNISIAIGLCIRESHVQKLFDRLETSRQNEFIPFYRAADIDRTCTYLVSLLLAVTTVRVIKILQFAKVFRLFINTLYNSRVSLATTLFCMAIFMIGISLALFIINGSYSENFLDFVTSFTTLLSLTLGMGSSTSPTELKMRRTFLGITLYILFIVVVTIFLINMFITIICDQFSAEHEEFENLEKTEDYHFSHFLFMEFEEYYDMNLDTLASKINGRPSERELNLDDHIELITLRTKIAETKRDILKLKTGKTKDEKAEEVVEISL